MQKYKEEKYFSSLSSPLSEQLYKLYKKVGERGKLIRFQGDDTGAYKEVREDIVTPQNLY